MVASAFLVTLPVEGGHTLRAGIDAVVVWATDATSAKEAASAHFDGDISWSGATATPVITTDFNGYRVRVQIEGTSIDVSVTGNATDNTIDEVAALLVTALNATVINGAAYDATTNILKIAETTDALGDKFVKVEFYAPGSERPIASLTGALVHGGASGAALTVQLPTDAVTPAKVYGAFRSVI